MKDWRNTKMTHAPNSDSEIFRDAAKLAPEERPAFLNEACGGNRSLHDEVESLLRAHDPDGSFLQSPAVVVTELQRIRELPGTMIGPYKLREQIGEGGFGVVYVAEQEKPIRRKVALKVIKPGMDTKDVIARFEAERQALGLMDHPNVARVFDAGATENGRPFFVMELVQGATIIEFCDRNRLPARQRLELFADVCRAVQHAHQKGIIHRDLKPSNIMITLHDGRPVVKVIDFGVSKALCQQLTEKSIYTAYGQMIGTPSYMSPEQAEMSGLGIDTRSDIYSLGVLLYELLTGQTPLDANRLRASGYAEMMRIIREEEPPRPSMKVSTLGDAATVIAQHRQTDPEHLRRDLSGEIDWIVMKCLEKDRSRRYETASGLARDIERFLKDEPVEACPPSALYRFRKLARKHRRLLTTAAAFVALMLVGCIVSTSLAVWAMRSQRQANVALEHERVARDEAVKARERSDKASQRLRDAIRISNEGIAYFNRKNWSAANERFTQAAEIEPELNTPYIYRASLYVRIGLWDRAAADYDRQFGFATSADAQTCFEHALLKLYNGDETGYREACEELLRHHGRSTEIPNRYTVLRSCLLASQVVGDPKELLQRAETLIANASSPQHVSIAGLAALRTGDYQLAVDRFRESLRLGTGSPAGIHRVNFATLALAQHHLGLHQEAEQSLSRAEEARNDWIDRMSTGMVDSMPIDWWEWLSFEIWYREAHELITGQSLALEERLATIGKRALSAIHDDDVFTWMDAGREQVHHQSWNRAAAQFIKVLDQMHEYFRLSSQEMRFLVEMVHQPEVFARLVELRPNDRRLWIARGSVHSSERNWAKAFTDFERALELLKQDELSETEFGYPALGHNLHVLGQLSLLKDDQPQFRQLCNTMIKEHSHYEDAFSAISISRACTLSPDGLTDWSIPLSLAQQAVDEQPRVPWYQFALGIACYRAEKYEEAIGSLNQSLEIGPNWLGRGQNHVVLAMAQQQLGRGEEARKSLARANACFNEMNRTMANSMFGFAASHFLGDWLCLQILLPEAEQLLENLDNL